MADLFSSMVGGSEGGNEINYRLTLTNDMSPVMEEATEDVKKMEEGTKKSTDGMGKAWGKTEKIIGNFGGKFGKIASGFGLGAASIVGAAVLVGKAIYDSIQKSIKAFEQFDATVKKTGLVFNGEMGRMQGASKDFAEEKGIMDFQSEFVKAKRGEANKGAMDKAKNFLMGGDDRTRNIRSLAGSYQLGGMSKKDAMEKANADIVNQEDEYLAAQMNKDLNEMTQSMSDGDAVRQKQIQTEKEAKDTFLNATSMTKEQSSAAVDLANRFFLLSQVEVTTQEKALKVSLGFSAMNVELSGMTSAMQDAVGGVRSLNEELGYISKSGDRRTSNMKRAGSNLNSAGIDTGELLRQKTFELMGGEGQKGVNPVNSSSRGFGRGGGVATPQKQFRSHTGDDAGEYARRNAATGHLDANMLITAKGDVHEFASNDTLNLQASNKGGAGGGGGVTINIYGSVVTERELINMVDKGLMSKVRKLVNV